MANRTVVFPQQGTSDLSGTKCYIHIIAANCQPGTVLNAYNGVPVTTPTFTAILDDGINYLAVFLTGDYNSRLAETVLATAGGGGGTVTDEIFDQNTIKSALPGVPAYVNTTVVSPTVWNYIKVLPEFKTIIDGYIDDKTDDLPINSATAVKDMSVTQTDTQVTVTKNVGTLTGQGTDTPYTIQEASDTQIGLLNKEDHSTYTQYGTRITALEGKGSGAPLVFASHALLEAETPAEGKWAIVISDETVDNSTTIYVCESNGASPPVWSWNYAGKMQMQIGVATATVAGLVMGRDDADGANKGYVYVNTNGTMQLIGYDELHDAIVLAFAASADSDVELSSSSYVSTTGTWTFKFKLPDSGVSAGSYGPTAGGEVTTSFDVPAFTVDAKGRVTAASTKEYTISIPQPGPTGALDSNFDQQSIKSGLSQNPAQPAQVDVTWLDGKIEDKIDADATDNTTVIGSILNSITTIEGDITSINEDVATERAARISADVTEQAERAANDQAIRNSALMMTSLLSLADGAYTPKVTKSGTTLTISWVAA
jgi:hypothetical protein